MSEGSPPPTVPAGSEGGHQADRSQSDADQVVTVGKLDELIAASHEVAEAASTGLERERVARRRFQMSMLTLGLIIAMLALSIHNLLSDLGDIARQNKSNGERIISCTTPEGECFKEGQERTGSAVRSINEVTFWASVCAPDFVDLPKPQREASIRTCITEGLKAE